MAERVAAIIGDDGEVENLVVLPGTDEELGAAWREQLPRVRVLTDDERKKGVGVGWRRAGNGRWVDERPTPPPPPKRAADGEDAPPVTPSPAGGSSSGAPSQPARP